MELWVRTQDKTTLIRSYEIYICEYGKDSYVIRAKRTSHILGAYKTMQRALEVLDEIQNILNAFNRINEKEGKYEDLDLTIKANMLNYVYEMPEA